MEPLGTHKVLSKIDILKSSFPFSLLLFSFFLSPFSGDNMEYKHGIPRQFYLFNVLSIPAPPLLGAISWHLCLVQFLGTNIYCNKPSCELL